MPTGSLPTPCTWQLHRNRIGIKGNFFKKIDYEVERELTEQELTDKFVRLAALSPLKVDSAAIVQAISQLETSRSLRELSRVLRSA